MEFLIFQWQQHWELLFRIIFRWMYMLWENRKTPTKKEIITTEGDFFSSGFNIWSNNEIMIPLVEVNYTKLQNNSKQLAWK